MFKFWCEYDINPLIIFDYKSNIVYCNQEAEIFLSYINKKEVFEFALKNAPKDGIKTDFKLVKFDKFEFNGYSIGFYEEKLGIRFFINTDKKNITLNNLEKVKFSMLLEFVKDYMELKNVQITTFYDPSIPEIYLNKKELINIIFEMLENSNKAKITSKILVGEYIKIDAKKYPLAQIDIVTPPFKRIKSNFFEIENHEEGYSIKIPLIKELDENNNT
jgi:nitrogen-specific signal transduction histidine kinase